MTSAVVATISFGHERADILAALKPAVEVRRDNANIYVVCIDDSSGNSPGRFDEFDSLHTTGRKGYAGAVNELVERLGGSAERLVLINPDAQIDGETLTRLIVSEEAVAVPAIRNADGEIENVRSVTTATQQIRALLLGERYAATPSGIEKNLSNGIFPMPPACPSGAVVSIDLKLLRQTPLREEFFWLELSDWTKRVSKVTSPLRLEVLKQEAVHVGASTSVKYPVSVAASQLRAKKAFVKAYGRAWHRLLLPIAMISRSIRFGVKTKSMSNTLFLVLVGLGVKDWRVSR